MGKKRPSGKKAPKRRLSLKAGLVLAALLAVWAVLSNWFVHHPRAWLEETEQSWPKAATDALYWLGNPCADLTDSLGWTGHDAVYEYDTPAPAGQVCFAGEPKRTGAPAPTDITVIDRGPFKIGWSPSLRHPVWCAYHVTAKARHEAGKRPPFAADRTVPSAPPPSAYKGSGYDRGHLVPNYAIVTRYGQEAQRKTFQMSNIAPQSPALNRGVWRDLEHRIAEFWTARYGELWVVVGCLSPQDGRRTLPGTGIDVPTDFYQVVVAQEGMDVRALAMLFSQKSGWHDWAARRILTIDELERKTGLDFNPDLPGFIQEPLEADLPTRLWPVRVLDALRQMLFRLQG